VARDGKTRNVRDRSRGAARERRPRVNAKRRAEPAGAAGWSRRSEGRRDGAWHMV